METVTQNPIPDDVFKSWKIHPNVIATDIEMSYEEDKDKDELSSSLSELTINTGKLFVYFFTCLMIHPLVRQKIMVHPNTNGAINQTDAIHQSCPLISRIYCCAAQKDEM